MKRKIYLFIKNTILKIPSEFLLPDKYEWINYLFFPIDSYYIKRYKINDWAFNFPNYIKIYGINYPLDLFKDLSRKSKSRVRESYTFLKDECGNVVLRRDFILNEEK